MFQGWRVFTGEEGTFHRSTYFYPRGRLRDPAACHVFRQESCTSAPRNAIWVAGGADRSYQPRSSIAHEWEEHSVVQHFNCRQTAGYGSVNLLKTRGADL